MNGKEIKEPQQKRSMAKKQRIIDAGYRIFCEKGYYQTHTAEIAREAGVSTGILYHYFHDKKDILLAVADRYIASLTERMESILAAPAADLSTTVQAFVRTVADSHTMNRKAHDELMAMALLHEDVFSRFAVFEEKIVDALCSYLAAAGVAGEELHARVRVCYGMAEQLCHTGMRPGQPPEELRAMEQITVQAMTAILRAV